MSELKPLVIGDLVVEKPIIQGGMGVGISLHRLAGAVAKAGGMGTISAAQIGFTEPDFRGSKLKVHPQGDETGQRNRTPGRDWFQYHGGYQAL